MKRDYPPELDLLDQLQGSNQPLEVMARIFADEALAKKAIGHLIRAGEVVLLDAAGAPVPAWRWAEIERGPADWATASGFFLSLTDTGARKA